jgi:hypothetical protein
VDPILGAFVASFGAAGLGALWLGARNRRSLVQVWMEVARLAGLEEVRLRTLAGWPTRVEARRGPLRVTLDATYNHAAERACTRVDIFGLSTEIGLWPQGQFPGVPRARDVAVGDGEFDSAIVVTGPPVLASALLREPVRRLVREMFAARVSQRDAGAVAESDIRVARGRLVASRVVGDQPEWIADHLGRLLALAEALRPVIDPGTRLAANARDDPEAGVRRTCLRRLASEYPGRPATMAALRQALADEDESVQVDAAIELGAEARPTLLEIATREWSSDECAARAVRELRSALPTEQARATLSLALRTRRTQTAEACLDSLSHRGPEQAEVLERVLGLTDGPLAAAAARALGHVGSAPAIVRLREAQARLAGDAALRRATREAIDAIRARLVGADAGQLALSAPEPGRVSLADESQGRLSLERDPDVPE